MSLVTPGIAGPTRANLRPPSKMEQYAKETLTVANEFKIPALDWFDICKDKDPKELLQADDLHYSEMAYRQLVEQLTPLLKNKLDSLS